MKTIKGNEKEIAKILNAIEIWTLNKEQSIPESNYYYYCFGIQQGLRIALSLID